MCDKFIKRGYPKPLVHGYKEKAKTIEREATLNPVRRAHKNNAIQRIPFMSAFGPQSGKISNIIRKHWALVRQGCSDVAAFSQPL